MSFENIPNWRLLCAALIVSLGGSFQFGYQLTIPNPAEDAFLEFVNNSMIKMKWNPNSSTVETVWGVIVSLCFIGAIFGSLSLKFTADLLGRRRALILFDIAMFIINGLAILAKFINSFILLGVTRLMTGFFIGPILSLAPLLLTECSPMRCRGFISMATGLMVQFGLCIGAIIAMPEVFGTREHWWLIYAFLNAVLAFVLVLLPFTHESPTFLITKGRIKEAKKSITFYGWCHKSEIDGTMKELEQSLEGKSRPIGMLEVYKDPITLRGTIVGSLVAFAVGMSGVDVMVSYSVSILRDCGVSRIVAELVQAGVNALSMISIMLSSFIVDSFGRRPLLLFTMLIIFICDIGMVSLMLVYQQNKTTLVGIIFIIVYVAFAFFFSTGPQCLCFFTASEMVAPNARAAAQSWAAFLQMASGAIAVGVFLPLKHAMTQPWAFCVLFVLPIGLLEVFFYFMLPETKNKELDEIVKEIDKLPKVVFCKRK